MPLNNSQITQLEASIRDFIDELYNNYVDTLTKLIQNSFNDGIRNAERNMKTKITYMNKQKIYDSIPETISYVENKIIPAFDTMYDILMDQLELCVRNRMELEETKNILIEKITYLEKNIPFDSVGEIIDTVELVDGIVIPAQKTISKKHTMSVDNYFGYISRDIAKMSYLQSKLNSYTLKGYSRFKYISRNDGKTRKKHKQLHNKTFIIGSQDAKLVLLILLEPNCRCDIIPVL